MILYMYIASEHGLTTPWGRKFDVSRNILSLRSFVASFKIKKKNLWSLILYNFFMILYMYIAPGQGLTTPWGRNFNVNRNILSLRSFVASLKKNLRSLFWYIYIFSWLYICVGHKVPRGQSFDVNRKALSRYPFVASFKEICLKPDFIHFFLDLIHVYIPWAYSTPTPQGTKFWY